MSPVSSSPSIFSCLLPSALLLTLLFCRYKDTDLSVSEEFLKAWDLTQALPVSSLPGALPPEPGLNLKLQTTPSPADTARPLPGVFPPYSFLASVCYVCVVSIHNLSPLLKGVLSAEHR